MINQYAIQNEDKNFSTSPYHITLIILAKECCNVQLNMKRRFYLQNRDISHVLKMLVSKKQKYKSVKNSKSSLPHVGHSADVDVHRL